MAQHWQDTLDAIDQLDARPTSSNLKDLVAEEREYLQQRVLDIQERSEPLIHAAASRVTVPAGRRSLPNSCSRPDFSGEESRVSDCEASALERDSALSADDEHRRSIANSQASNDSEDTPMNRAYRERVKREVEAAAEEDRNSGLCPVGEDSTAKDYLAKSSASRRRAAQLTAAGSQQRRLKQTKVPSVVPSNAPSAPPVPSEVTPDVRPSSVMNSIPQMIHSNPHPDSSSLHNLDNVREHLSPTAGGRSRSVSTPSSHQPRNRNNSTLDAPPDDASPPPTDLGDILPSAPSAFPPFSALPEGWEEVSLCVGPLRLVKLVACSFDVCINEQVTSSEGPTYYYHTLTRATQWERPAPGEGDNAPSTSNAPASVAEETPVLSKKAEVSQVCPSSSTLMESFCAILLYAEEKERSRRIEARGGRAQAPRSGAN